MITTIEKEWAECPPLSWYKEQLRQCVERERLNHSYKREVLLETLYEMREPMSVDSLYFAMSRERRGKISINTVYRNIKLLVTCDLVVRIEVDGTPKYMLNSYKPNTISVVCRQSGRVYKLDAPGNWRFQLLQMLQAIGFETDGEIVLNVECQHKKAH